MAAPPEITLKDLSGKWVMVNLFPFKGLFFQDPNAKDRTRPSPTILMQFSHWYILSRFLQNTPKSNVEKQGISWFLRKIIALATITLEITQYEEDSITHIDIDQFATGGIKTTEKRTLNWQVKRHEDSVFGVVFGQSRWIKLADVDDDEFLKTGWDDLNGEHIQSYVESHDKGWTVNQVCPLCF